MNKNYTEIYNSYDIYNKYPIDDVRQELAEWSVQDCSEITTEEIYDAIYWKDHLDWKYAQNEMEKFFNNEEALFILQGTNHIWSGNCGSGMIFRNTDFLEVLENICNDYDDIKIYDKGGRFYIEASYHNGRSENHFEIRKLTDKGINFYYRWKSDWSDDRTEKDVRERLMKYYSKNLHFAKTMYGTKEFTREKKQENTEEQFLETA